MCDVESEMLLVRYMFSSQGTYILPLAMVDAENERGGWKLEDGKEKGD
jgi:hypothetical protein